MSYRLIGFLGFAALYLATAERHFTPDCKPAGIVYPALSSSDVQGPVSLKATVRGQPTRASTWVSVSMTTNMPSDAAEFEVVMPQGTRLVSGTRTWRGAIEDEVGFEFALSVPDDERYEISFVGRIRLPSGRVVGDAQNVVIDLGAPSPPRRTARIVTHPKYGRLRITDIPVVHR